MGSRPSGGGWYFHRRATDPLVAWATVVGLAVAAFFFGLLSLGAPDELGQMAAAFNTMANTAVEAEDVLHCSFARGVAHELRTPLSVLQSQLEALQDGLAAPSRMARWLPCTKRRYASPAW